MVIDEDDSPVVRQFKTKIVAPVEKRWNLASFVPTEVSVLATVLDPWFRQFSFWTEEQKDQVKATLLLQKHVQKKDTEDTETPNPKRKKPAFDILLGEESDLSNSNSFETQFTQFLGEKSISCDDSVLEW